VALSRAVCAAPAHKDFTPSKANCQGLPNKPWQSALSCVDDGAPGATLYFQSQRTRFGWSTLRL